MTICIFTYIWKSPRYFKMQVYKLFLKIIYCHEGQRSKCRKIKLHLSGLWRAAAAPGCMLRTALLNQESSHCLEVGTPSASEGLRFWLPVFWWFTIICFKVLNFNISYNTNCVPSCQFPVWGRWRTPQLEVSIVYQGYKLVLPGRMMAVAYAAIV